MEKRGKTWNLILNLKGGTWKNVEKRAGAVLDFPFSDRVLFPFWGGFAQRLRVRSGHGGGGSTGNTRFYPKGGRSQQGQPEGRM